jgi:hypothetical protein
VADTAGVRVRSTSILPPGDRADRDGLRVTSVARTLADLAAVEPPHRLRLPHPRTNATVLGLEVDCWWPRARVVVELDGRTHHARVAALTDDRARDRRLVLAGSAHSATPGRRHDARGPDAWSCRHSCEDSANAVLTGLRCSLW